MNLVALKEVKSFFAAKVRELDAIDTSCRGCAHFSDGRTCAKWKAEPPAEFKTNPGKCADWEFDGIPF